MPAEHIPGSRPGSDRKKPRIYSLASLEMKNDEATALKNLYKKVWTDGANCLDDERFTSDRQMTPAEAQRACAGCPALALCREYAENYPPAHGVWGGKPYTEQGTYDEGEWEA